MTKVSEFCLEGRLCKDLCGSEADMAAEKMMKGSVSLNLGMKISRYR